MILRVEISMAIFCLKNVFIERNFILENKRQKFDIEQKPLFNTVFVRNYLCCDDYYMN